MRPAHFRICRESDNGGRLSLRRRKGRERKRGKDFSRLLLIPPLSSHTVHTMSKWEQSCNLVAEHHNLNANRSKSHSSYLSIRCRSGDHALCAPGGDGAGDFAADVPELVRGRAQEGDHLPRELHLRGIRAGRKGQLSGMRQQRTRFTNSEFNGSMPFYGRAID